MPVLMSGTATRASVRAWNWRARCAARSPPRPGRTGPDRVGVEIELVPLADGGRPAPARLAPVLDARFAAVARPTFEPGGQLELSPAPQPLPAVIDTVLGLLRRVRERAARVGVELIAAGTDPHHDCTQVPLHRPTARYLALQRALDGHGPDGRRMMRLTASLQVCVDLRPGRAGREQWLVANLAGPHLAAAFANSPTLDGRPAGVDGARTGIWTRVDPRRCAYDGRHLDAADPVGAYLAFAAAAPRLPLPGLDARGHLSTLFPPVRPRGGYLEVRYLDAQPDGRIAAAVHTVHTLLTHPRARREALDLLLPGMGDLPAAWRAAADGWTPHAADLLAIAACAQAALGEVPAR
ncbi:glutamate-cysteine ligase family protein [Pseudonocardia hydrocarbonoxydans]|uniref:glutamate-cysteine ligase family protein n=1 Tax=Pseudonocardia hydrocarbonoxydans TaxID=76726 RepID=UPI0011425AE2|nr:glutamate-cysteine ligase family protein [Pseudonocardia hydrocarbonoxydans]